MLVDTRTEEPDSESRVIYILLSRWKADEKICRDIVEDRISRTSGYRRGVFRMVAELPHEIDIADRLFSEFGFWV